MSIKIIGISFGHNDKFNVGAIGILKEDVVNKEVGQKVIDILNKDNLVIAKRLYKENVVSYDDSLLYRPKLANEWGCTLIIDIHHNSFGQESANGTECLCYSDEASTKLSKCIVDRVVAALGTTNRGVKYNNYVFNINAKMASTIYEGFFISNKSDCNKYNSSKEAEAIVLGIYDYLGLKKPNNTGAGTRIYIVKSGDTLYSISRALGVSIDSLIKNNGIVDKNKIYVNQKLKY